MAAHEDARRQADIVFRSGALIQGQIEQKSILDNCDNMHVHGVSVLGLAGEAQLPTQAPGSLPASSPRSMLATAEGLKTCRTVIG